MPELAEDQDQNLNDDDPTKQQQQQQQQNDDDDPTKGKGGDDDQLPEHEVAAREKGWRPKDEWEGDPDDWRPAKQFLEWGEMRSTIKNQNTQIKGMKKSYTQDIANLNAVHKTGS